VISVLVRENPAVRALGKWVIFTFVTGALSLNLLTFTMFYKAGPVLGLPADVWFTLLAWIPISLYLVFGKVGMRCSSFDMTLPLPLRRVWLAHMIAVALGALILLAVSIIVATGGGLLMLKISDRWILLMSEVRRTSVFLLSGLLLALAVVEYRAPQLQRVPATRSNRTMAAVTVLAVLAAIFWMKMLPPIVAVIPVLAAGVLGARRFLSLPESFTVTPDGSMEAEPLEQEAEAWTQPPPSRLRANLLVAGVLYRSLYRKKVAVLLVVPFLVPFGMLLGGADEAWFHENVRAAMIPMASYTLMAFIMDPLMHFGRVDAFPISRRRVLALFVAPLLLSLIVGYGAGRIVVARDTTNEPISLFQADDGNYYVRVPLETCELARQGHVPMNRSPWAEEYRAWSAPVYRGSAVEVYSPFSVGAGASVDFTAWQISRAVKTVFGEAITPEEIEHRYLRERSDGSAALRTEALTLRADHPEWKRRYMGPVFPLTMTLVIVLWLAALWVFFGGARAGKGIRRRTLRGFALMGVLFGLYGAVMVAAATHFATPARLMGSVQILGRSVSEAFPGGSLLVWVACAAVTAASYIAVQRRFDRAEGMQEGGARS
jgi:hypothetical protein